MFLRMSEQFIRVIKSLVLSIHSGIKPLVLLIPSGIKFILWSRAVFQRKRFFTDL